MARNHSRNSPFSKSHIVRLSCLDQSDLQDAVQLQPAAPHNGIASKTAIDLPEGKARAATGSVSHCNVPCHPPEQDNWRCVGDISAGLLKNILEAKK